MISLRNELSAVKKGIDLIDVYSQRIKQIRDRLAIISVILDDEELLYIALDGLPSNYDSFSAAINNTLLNVEERAIRKRSGVIDASTMAMAANYQPPGFGRGRGSNSTVVFILMLLMLSLLLSISLNLFHQDLQDL